VPVDADLVYDGPYPYDDPSPFDGPELAAFYFTPPNVAIDPPFLPDTPRGPALSLFRHYELRQAGVDVFILSNGTVVQNYATSENSNTSIPYPWDPYYLPPTPFARVIDYHGVETDFRLNPYIVTVFYGGHGAYVIDDDTYNTLVAAGYTTSLRPIP
jgi:hypothetical protein